MPIAGRLVYRSNSEIGPKTAQEVRSAFSSAGCKPEIKACPSKQLTIDLDVATRDCVEDAVRQLLAWKLLDHAEVLFKPNVPPGPLTLSPAASLNVKFICRYELKSGNSEPETSLIVVYRKPRS
jgi:hypothetical protein